MLVLWTWLGKEVVLKTWPAKEKEEGVAAVDRDNLRGCWH